MVDCPDEPGLIYRISEILFRSGANIVRNQEYVDEETARFFMRTEFSNVSGVDGLLEALQAILPAAAQVKLKAVSNPDVVILATQEHHCLGELLLLNAFNELGASISAVISNHNTLRPLADQFGIPFHFITHEGVPRPEHEAQLMQAISSYGPEYVILAKYMRVLGPTLLQEFPHRIINIHHSFLPAFIGAQPYRQAFERGVKLIGATAHFVTEVLDEGPIIAQSVIPVDHNYSPARMAQAGRDIEKLVLAKAIRLVSEERVLLVGNRTIVFE